MRWPRYHPQRAPHTQRHSTHVYFHRLFSYMYVLPTSIFIFSICNCPSWFDMCVVFQTCRRLAIASIEVWRRAQVGLRARVWEVCEMCSACGVLQCVAVCGRVLQCVAMCRVVLHV